MDVANSLNISNTSVQTGQNATQNAPVRKNEGSLFKNQPAGTPSEQSVSNALDNVGKLVARVLDDLKSASSLSKAEQILSQAKDTKIAPNLASELSDLAKSLEAEAAQNESPEIKSLALKLKEFLKPIADLKAGSLNDQIKNSGVMLEANLKDALTPEKLPSSIQKLLSDIKNLSNQNFKKSERKNFLLVALIGSVPLFLKLLGLIFCAIFHLLFGFQLSTSSGNILTFCFTQCYINIFVF